jgi:hypothetical protein
MANLLESSQNQATVAPDFYNNYLSNLAGAGTSAATNAQYVGAQPLQQQAFQDVAGAASAYQPTLEQAGQTLGTAGNVTSPLGAATPYLQNAGNSPAELASQYMSPYITSVVNALGDTGQRNIMQNLAPQATAGAVGSGQFGSKRGAEVLGQTLSNADRDILNQQYQALNTGYGQALQAGTAQNQLQGQLGSTAGQLASAGQQNLTQLGNAQSNLAGQNQALGLADINALSTLGGQQQTIAQNQQLFPLTNLSTLSGLLRGYSVPTTTKTTASASPLSIIGGAITGTAGLFTKNPTTGLTPYDSLVSGLSGAYNKMTGSTPATPTAIDTTQGYTTPQGQNLSYGSPVIGTGSGGGPGAGQVLGSDGKIYQDPTYGNTSAYTSPNTNQTYETDAQGNTTDQNGISYTP